MEPIRAVEILIEKIKRDYRDDVALVVIMGSYIYNQTHSRSDIDMFFVPKTERGHRLGFTFIIDGIGFDYFCIPWERLTHIAVHGEKITSIITEGKVLYCGSPEDMDRFNELKSRALDISDRCGFTERAAAKLSEAYKEWFLLSKSADLGEARMHAMGVISAVTHALALLNRATVKRGRTRLKGEIMDMPLVPHDFSRLYDTVFISRDIGQIQGAYGQLIADTGALIAREQDKLGEPESFAARLTGFYEELTNCYNKVYHACEIGDACGALFAATEIIHELSHGFVGTRVSFAELPDLVGGFDHERLPAFQSLAQSHQAQCERLFQENGVTFRRFGDFGELEGYLDML